MTLASLVRTLVLGTSAVLLSQSYATAEEKLAGYTDSLYDFSIGGLEDWKTAPLTDYTVPGVARAAYSRPNGASIVLFVQEPGKAFEPRFLVDESAKAMAAKLGASVVEQEVRDVGGKRAMWLVVEGKGTGGALDGSGPVKTSQHWIAIPREKDIVVALLTSPTSEFEGNEKSFLDLIKTIEVGGNQTQAQAASK